VIAKNYRAFSGCNVPSHTEMRYQSGKISRLKLCAVVLAAAALLIVGCDGMKLKQARRLKDFSVSADDFNQIAEATFALIDPKKNITTIVIPPTLDLRAIAALKRVRPVTAFVPVAPTAVEILPAGYFLVRTFTIVGDDAQAQATIEGQLGPVTRTMTAANLPDCGTIYSVVFFLTGGDWFNPSYMVETCAESRHWTPIDAQQPQ
jgi:hypothetical protein